jgi:hypothetical protein
MVRHLPEAIWDRGVFYFSMIFQIGIILFKTIPLPSVSSDGSITTTI